MFASMDTVRRDQNFSSGMTVCQLWWAISHGLLKLLQSICCTVANFDRKNSSFSMAKKVSLSELMLNSSL